MSIPREQRTSKERPCPICGRTHYCFFAITGDSVWCSQESQGGRPWKGGWMHDLVETPRPIIRRKLPAPRPKPDVDWSAFSHQCEADMALRRLRRLADRLHLSTDSLRRLHIGWASRAALWRQTKTPCRGEGAWSFPLYDGQGKTIGIRLRSDDGGKFTASGSAGDGLLIPDDLPAGGVLVAPEGPTSTAAALDLGLRAVGRPNNCAGGQHLRTLAARLAPSRLAILGDNDLKEDGRWPGRDGAMVVGQIVASAVPDIRLVLPPDGFKDIRDWAAAGVRPEVVRGFIRKSPRIYAARQEASA